MTLALFVSALLMGLAGTPHCLAMCGPACTVLARERSAALAFHAARVLSYALVGAVVAASVSSVGLLGQITPALRPLWTLVHAAALALGLWLLVRGRQPAWLENLGRRGRRAAGLQQAVQAGQGGPAGPQEHAVQVVRHVPRWPWRSAAAGLLWPAWPCGLLQSALVVAALANTAWGGAAVMAAFAAASAAGLLLGPALWWRLAGGRPSAGAASGAGVWAARLAGAMLVLASAWALGHGLWMKVAAWCFG
jgi:sulfite exporter TauE/SafE